ncbi:MAG: ABC transporter ATP-binding protein [Clostridia bacterium]|nr:ABC transporter ATP-binding protein [Clostridia bacterium]
MIKKLAKNIGEYKLPSILAPLSVTAEVIMEVLMPITMAQIIDKGIYGNNMNFVVKTGLILVLMTIMSLVFGALSGSFAAKASAGFAKNLRKNMYHRVQEFSFLNIDKFSTSSIVTRLTTDVTHLQNAYQMIIRIAVRSPAMMIFSLVMAISINKKLSLVFLFAIPVITVSLFVISKNAHPIFEKMFKKYDRLNTVVQENVRGVRVVKSFVRDGFEVDKFGEASDDIQKLSKRAERILSFNGPIMQLCVYTCILLISWFGARIIVSTGATELTTGQLTSLISYTTQILMSLMMMSMIFVMITMSRASAKRIVEILDEESTITNIENVVMDVADGSIEFKNVFFGYNKKMCLRNINLKINSGETVGIIGGTGSSKTSLIQLIPRLYDVNDGAVYVGGRDVREYDIEALRNQVSVVLQKNELFSGTIKDNLRWGNKDATDEEIIRVCKLAQADEFVQSFPDKYDTYIEQGGTNVSGGQKQRLCIARALLKKPKILILDDSTSAVDTKTDALIKKAFAEEIPNTTKLIIAQRVSSVQDADKIVIMENGEIDDVGTHDELLARNEIYKEIYYSQVKGGEEDGTRR